MEETEDELVSRVDVFPGVHQATEPDEETVLRELYGESDEGGIYRGEGS